MEQLFLGVGRKNITPHIGGHLLGYDTDCISKSVADDLTVTAFYFRQNKREVLLINATVCVVQNAFADCIRTQIEEKFGIPKKYVLLCVTHTHSGPDVAGISGWGDFDQEYAREIFVPKLMEAVEEANASLAPVKVGIATGDSRVGINRRELKLNNRVDFGQNEWGCYDPKMTVIAFQNPEGKSVANIIHYGAHGTAAGRNTEITRDWSGIMVDTLEKLSGGLTAFFLGPAGDVGPRITNGKTTGNLRYVYELGFAAARDAAQIYRKIRSFTDISLTLGHGQVGIPLKKRMDYESVLAKYEEYKDKTINLDGMIRKHFQDVLHSYENGYEEKELFVVDQAIIRIGDIAFATCPYEPFSEIGMRIDKASKIPHVLMLPMVNGYEGYFVTQDQICRGGYEVDYFLYEHIQQFCDNADWYLVKETVRNLETVVDEEVK